MSRVYKYDICLSFSLKDKAEMVELAKRLKEDGIRVYSKNLPSQISSANSKESAEESFENSRILVFGMSVHSLGKEWPDFEAETFRFRNVEDEELRFVPLKLDTTEAPLVLKRFASIDWQLPSEAQYARLLAAMKRSQVVGGIKEDEGGAVICKTLQVTVSNPTCIALSLGSDYAFTGNLNGKISRWHLQSGKFLGEFGDANTPIEGLSITCDSKFGVTGRYDGALSVWDLNEGNLLYNLKTHSGYVRAVAITPNGEYAVSGSGDGSVILTDLKNKRIEKQLIGLCDQVNAVAISDDGRRVVACTRGCELGLWNVKDPNM